VLPALESEIAGYAHTKGSLHFPIDQPLPQPLVKKMVELRLQQIRQA
jgi:uncharacterized protein YdhG (YjbR/CyaY superfamily)